MSEPSRSYSITAKGREVLRGPTLWCLSAHLRDVLVLCDPRVSLAHLRQTLPPESLNTALFAMLDLGLVEGPPVPAPDHSHWEADARSRPIGLPRQRRAVPRDVGTTTGAPAPS